MKTTNAVLFLTIMLNSSCSHLETSFDPARLGSPVTETDQVPSNYVLFSGLDEQPRIKKFNQVIPECFPIFGKEAHDSVGTQVVITEIMVGKDGIVNDVFIRETNFEAVAKLARRLVMNTEYYPALLNGEPVEWHGPLTISFPNEN